MVGSKLCRRYQRSSVPAAINPVGGDGRLLELWESGFFFPQKKSRLGSLLLALLQISSILRFLHGPLSFRRNSDNL